MDLKKVIVIPKLSKYEMDLARLRVDEEELMQIYKKERIDGKRILESHIRQKRSFEKIRNYFSPEQFISRNALTKDKVKKAELVISFGGDNHFLYISHFIDGVPILGINSDPERSEGGLNSITIEQLDRAIEMLKNNIFKIDEWTRIKVSVNDKPANLMATSEIFIGELERNKISRHVIEYRGKKEEQKCAGIIISTGAGSTGWYSSASRHLGKEGKPFARNERIAKFLITEPFRARTANYTFTHGIIKEGEELRVYSLNDSHGIVSIDSVEEIPFPEGSCARVSIGKPIKVVRFDL